VAVGAPQGEPAGARPGAGSAAVAPTGAARSAVAERPAREGAYVLLEDGTRFDGEGCGALGEAVGEVVFTTGMSGYQESMSDPSFAGQLITFTYPHIGNYGASASAMESGRVWARAALMRDAREGADSHEAERGWLEWLREQGVPGITGVDTRALVRHIREAGAMRGGLFGAETPEEAARERIVGEPSMLGRDLASEVSPAAPVLLESPEDLRRHLAGRERGSAGAGARGASVPPGARDGGADGRAGAARAGARGAGGPLVAVLDTGVKASILRSLLERGARVELHPPASSAREVLAKDPDGVLLANGPGDPAALEPMLATIRELLGARPVWGICLGHQLLCRALGLETYKLPFGHRGANHPVKDLRTGRIAITSQNHGFAVLGPGGEERMTGEEPVEWETPRGRARLSHVNLYDRTVEGIELLDVPATAVQYHPEAGPGPHDSLDLFDRFLAGLDR
jgi:carbamoyl-phosphate synthase small subunit